MSKRRGKSGAPRTRRLPVAPRPSPSSSSAGRRRPETIDVHWYVVAYIDLLGYEEQLIALDSVLSAVGLDQPVADHHMRSTIGRVVVDLEFVRNTIEDYFKSYQTNAPKSEWAEQIRRGHPQHWQKYKRFLNCEYRMQTVSDSIIVSVPLKESSKHFPLTGVDGLLAGCAAAMAWCLAANIPIRGAVALGAGTSYFGADIVSTALGTAAKLEKQAGHPRIVVSDRVVEYLTAQSHRSGDDEDRYCQSMAAGTLKLLRDDGDGFTSLDYLGPELRHRMGEGTYDDLLRRAYAFITEARNSFESAGDDKLASRYRTVALYFESAISDILSGGRTGQHGRIIRGQTIASTHADNSGERLSPEELRHLFEQIDERTVNTSAHDMSLRPICHGFNKRLVQLPDGELSIKMDIEILDEDAFARMGGFSIAFTRRTIRFGDSSSADLRVLVNPRQFDLDQVARLVSPALPRGLTVDVTERVEKGQIDTAIVVVVVYLGAKVLDGMFSAIGETLWSRLRQLRRIDRPTDPQTLQLIIVVPDHSTRIVLTISDAVSAIELAQLDLSQVIKETEKIVSEQGVDRIVGIVEPGPSVKAQFAVLRNGTTTPLPYEFTAKIEDGA